MRSPEQQEEYELRKAEERLRTIEMISKYREDKIKAEFRKLESDLKAQDHKNFVERQRTKEKRNFYDRQKRRTVEHYSHIDASNSPHKNDAEFEQINLNVEKKQKDR